MRSLRLKFPDHGGEARGGGYAFLVLGLAVLAAVLYQFNQAMNELAYWDLRIASMDRRVERKSAPAAAAARINETPETKREIRKANALLNELDLPWEALFDAIEYASNHDVALLSFQPDPSSRKMRIGGEAKNVGAMLEFVGALEREPALKDAHLLRYEIKRDDPYRPVTFSLTATWG
jgi:hypothetical protein